MANVEQLNYVGRSCPGYEKVNGSFQSMTSSGDERSCLNCENYKNNKCVINLFDRVLTSVDQT